VHVVYLSEPSWMFGLSAPRPIDDPLGNDGPPHAKADGSDLDRKGIRVAVHAARIERVRNPRLEPGTCASA